MVTEGKSSKALGNDDSQDCNHMQVKHDIVVTCRPEMQMCLYLIHKLAFLSVTRIYAYIHVHCAKRDAKQDQLPHAKALTNKLMSFRLNTHFCKSVVVQYKGQH